MVGMSDNSRIESKDGIKEGDDVLLNPRATVDEAREEERTYEKVDVMKRFGGDKPAAMPAAPGAAGASGKSKGGRPQLNFAELDKNKDGKLVKEELPERMQSFFDALDTNKDGGVKASELAEARKKMQQARPEQGAPGGPGGPSAGGQ